VLFDLGDEEEEGLEEIDHEEAGDIGQDRFEERKVFETGL